VRGSSAIKDNTIIIILIVIAPANTGRVVNNNMPVINTVQQISGSLC
jgi:hypothetical protein